MVYIKFSCHQKSIRQTADECSEALDESLTFKDFCLGYFKNPKYSHFTRDNLNLSFNDGSISTPKHSVAISCIENSVCHYMGTPRNNFPAPRYLTSAQVIYYDLENMEESVLNFTSKTCIPEFFFWKTILKHNQDTFPAEYEQFGDLYISSEYSEIWNCGTKIVLKNSYFKEEETETGKLTKEGMVVVDKKDDEKFDRFLESIAKVVDAFKSQ